MRVSEIRVKQIRVNQGLGVCMRPTWHSRYCLQSQILETANVRGSQ